VLLASTSGKDVTGLKNLLPERLGSKVQTTDITQSKRIYIDR